MNLRPLHDRILVKQLEAEEVTKGGIIIPDNVKEKPLQGKVVAVGSGQIVNGDERRRPAVRVGDEVLFSAYAGTVVKLEGIEHMMLREDDILGVVEREKKDGKRK